MKQLLSRSRALHYADIFLAAFVVSLAANSQHFLGAHGLNALKAAGIAALVAGGKAVLEAYRKANAKKPAPAPLALSFTPNSASSVTGTAFFGAPPSAQPEQEPPAEPPAA